MITVDGVKTAFAVVGVIATMCAVWVVCVAIAERWRAKREQERIRREAPFTRPGWQFVNNIQSLDRWCCWHFPIVEDICGWLLREGCSIDEFRERLFLKYGKRAESSAAPDPTAPGACK